MSKKETEFDRYERMKKLQREAAVEKKKHLDVMMGKKKKGGKTKLDSEDDTKNWTKNYDLALADEYEEA